VLQDRSYYSFCGGERAKGEQEEKKGKFYHRIITESQNRLDWKRPVRS